MNLYPDGQCTGQLCPTPEHALNHSTYTGDVPDAAQVPVRICTVKEWDALIESLNVCLGALSLSKGDAESNSERRTAQDLGYATLKGHGYV